MYGMTSCTGSRVPALPDHHLGDTSRTHSSSGPMKTQQAKKKKKHHKHQVELFRQRSNEYLGDLFSEHIKVVPSQNSQKHVQKTLKLPKRHSKNLIRPRNKKIDLTVSVKSSKLNEEQQRWPVTPKHRRNNESERTVPEADVTPKTYSSDGCHSQISASQSSKSKIPRKRSVDSLESAETPNKSDKMPLKRRFSDFPQKCQRSSEEMLCVVDGPLTNEQFDLRTRYQAARQRSEHSARRFSEAITELVHKRQLQALKCKRNEQDDLSPAAYNIRDCLVILRDVRKDPSLELSETVQKCTQEMTKCDSDDALTHYQANLKSQDAKRRDRHFLDIFPGSESTDHSEDQSVELNQLSDVSAADTTDLESNTDNIELTLGSSHHMAMDHSPESSDDDGSREKLLDAYEACKRQSNHKCVYDSDSKDSYQFEDMHVVDCDSSLRSEEISEDHTDDLLQSENNIRDDLKDTECIERMGDVMQPLSPEQPIGSEKETVNAGSGSEHDVNDDNMDANLTETSKCQDSFSCHKSQMQDRHFLDVIPENSNHKSGILTDNCPIENNEQLKIGCNEDSESRDRCLFTDMHVVDRDSSFRIEEIHEEHHDEGDTGVSSHCKYEENYTKSAITCQSIQLSCSSLAQSSSLLMPCSSSSEIALSVSSTSPSVSAVEHSPEDTSVEDSISAVKHSPEDTSVEDSISAVKHSPEDTSVEDSVSGSFSSQTRSLSAHEKCSGMSPIDLNTFLPPPVIYMVKPSKELTLNTTTPKGHKRKIRCRKLSRHQEPFKVNNNSPTQIDELCSAFQYHASLHDVPEHPNLPELCQALVEGCEEDGHLDLQVALQFLDMYTGKYSIPKNITTLLLKHAILDLETSELYFNQAAGILREVSSQHAGSVEVRWEMLSSCLEQLVSDGPVIELRLRLLRQLELLVDILKSDLCLRDISDSQKIYKSLTHRLLAYDVASSNRKRIVNFLRKSLLAEFGGDAGLQDRVIQLIQTLLAMSVDISSSCVDCASALARELLVLYTCLPCLRDKQRLLTTIVSPLLKFKLCQLLLETQYIDTQALNFGLPACLTDIRQAFFKAAPLKNPQTKPWNGDEEEEGEDVSLFNTQDLEELCLLLFTSVTSYLKAASGNCDKALRHRVYEAKSEMSLRDEMELREFAEHVSQLEEHLQGFNSNLSPQCTQYLLYMKLLEDAV